MITWNRRILQSLEYGTYYWCRLYPHRKSLQRLIKNLEEYHDLYVQNDTWLLADVFENFRNMWLEIYKLDPTKFFSVPGLAWQKTFKKIKVKLDLLTCIDMLLVAEKGIRGGICHSFYWCTKANNKYMKNYDKNKELSSSALGCK